MKEEQKEAVIVTSSFVQQFIHRLAPCSQLLLAGRYCDYSYLTNEESEAQRG